MAESKLNQFLDDLDLKILECSICFKRLREPKSFQCLHSFCKVCLQEWMETKGNLSCPTCLRTYPIPEGGVKFLPPNTFLNNLLEIVEQVEKGENLECVCGKAEQTEYYCTECRLYLCSACGDHHLKFPGFANHKLHPKQEISKMSPQQLAALHPPRCSQHNECLKFFCTGCKVPVCMHCAITDHNVVEGTHKLINISEAFGKFRETADELKQTAEAYKKTLQNCLTDICMKALLLSQCKESSLEDIENCVEKLIKGIKEKENELKQEVQRVFVEKNKVSENQRDELRSIMADVNTKLKFVDQLTKSDEATAMKSSDIAIEALKTLVQDLPTVESINNGQLHFIDNKANIETIQESDIGCITEKKREENWRMYIDKISTNRVAVAKKTLQEREAKALPAKSKNAADDKAKVTSTLPRGATPHEVKCPRGQWAMGMPKGLDGDHKIDKKQTSFKKPAATVQPLMQHITSSRRGFPHPQSLTITSKNASLQQVSHMSSPFEGNVLLNYHDGQPRGLIGSQPQRSGTFSQQTTPGEKQMTTFLESPSFFGMSLSHTTQHKSTSHLDTSQPEDAKLKPNIFTDKTQPKPSRSCHRARGHSRKKSNSSSSRKKLQIVPQTNFQQQKQQQQQSALIQQQEQFPTTAFKKQQASIVQSKTDSLEQSGFQPKQQQPRQEQAKTDSNQLLLLEQCTQQLQQFSQQQQTSSQQQQGSHTTNQ